MNCTLNKLKEILQNPLFKRFILTSKFALKKENRALWLEVESTYPGVFASLSELGFILVRQIPLETCFCQNCGQGLPFRDGYRNKYCSHKCTHEHQRKVDQEAFDRWLEDNPDHPVKPESLKEFLFWQKQGKEPEIVFCKNCGKLIKFKNNKFASYCCPECAHSSPEVNKKKSRTMHERYDGHFWVQNPENLRKMQETCIQRYGAKTYNESSEYQERKQEIQEKIKTAFKERYGVDRPMQSQAFKEKHLPEMLEKSRATSLARYGVESPNQRPEMIERQRKHNAMFSEEVRARHREAVNSPEFHERQYRTKKAHNSFNTSEPENKAHALLLAKFPDVKTQYQDARYSNPETGYKYKCDFYAPSLDLFVELQEHWTHGSEPFSPDNAEHGKIVNTWQERAYKYGGKANLYSMAVHVWTELDVAKRKIALDNGLNWLEFFSVADLEAWLASV